MLETKDISKQVSVVIQGSTLGDHPEYGGKLFLRTVIESIRKHLPDACLILSTWEKEKDSIAPDLPVNEVLFNKDPGFRPRGLDPNSKPNNVNRQIVSTLNGLRTVKTKYALKMRTDFLMTGTGFLSAFGKFSQFEPEYRVFEERVIVCMFGTRHPIAPVYNLPFHVGDFATFGLTSDLLNLYDIPLETDEEFFWLQNHPELTGKMHAANRYNAEQHIIMNFLRKNGKHIPCEYATHVNEHIASESNRFLINNFYPLSFPKYGIQPLKNQLRAMADIRRYTDYFTQYEWQELYKRYCDASWQLPTEDAERTLIDKSIVQLAVIKKLAEQRYQINEEILGRKRLLSSQINSCL